MRAVGPVALLALLAASCTCDGSPAPTIRRGVAVWRSRIAVRPRALGGEAVRPGDFVMESPVLRVIVAGQAREGSGPPAGSVLEVRPRRGAGDDGIRRLVPWLRIGRRSAELVLDELTVAERSDALVVRASWNGAGADDGLRVVRELSFLPSGDAIAIKTLVRAPRGRAVEALTGGATVGWGGATPFAPGPGFLGDDARYEVPWIGREGPRYATILSARPGPLTVRSSFERRSAADGSSGEGALLSDTEVVGAAFSLRPGTARALEQLVVLGRGGLEVALGRLLRLRPVPHGTVRVRLPYDPPGATVTVLRPDGRVALRGRFEGGITELPLPPGRYSLGAVAPGHAASDAVDVETRAGEQRELSLRIPEGGRIRIRARDVQTGEPLLARARVLAMAPTPRLDLGPRWRAAGAGDTVILRSGEAEVRAPPGRYRVVVTRGPEWTIHSQIVTVTGSFRPEVVAELGHVVDSREWVPCELHVHQLPSPDSQVPLADRVAALAAEGIRFAVPTDHNAVTDLRPAAVALEPLAMLVTVPGVEVTTETRVFGHFNVFPVEPDPLAPGLGAPPWLDLSPTELFTGARAGDPARILQVNHPRFEDGIGYFAAMGMQPDGSTSSPDFDPTFDAIEVWNGYDLATPGEPDATLQQWFTLLSLGRRYVATGNSDSHHVTYTWAGYPRTYVRVEGSDREAPLEPARVLESLRAGHAFVTSGPFLEATAGGAGPGDLARPSGSRLRVRILLQTPPWMQVSRVELVRDGDVVRTLAVRVPRGQRRDRAMRVELATDLPVEHDGWLVVVARGDRTMDEVLVRPVPPIAFTNPIIIDADGDGLSVFSDWDEERARWVQVPADAADGGVDADGGAGPDGDVPAEDARDAEARDADAVDARAADVPDAARAGAVERDDAAPADEDGG